MFLRSVVIKVVLGEPGTPGYLMVAMEGSGVEGARWYEQQASHQVHATSRLNPHQEELQVPSPYFPGAYHGYSSAMNQGMHHSRSI